MSYSDEPELTIGQKVGCFSVGTLLLFLNFLFLVGAALSHCAPDEYGGSCENYGFYRFLMFPGFLIFPILVIIGLIGWMKRGSN